MQIFTAVDIALMGEMDETYGQTYYGTVKEQSNPVRFNLKQVVDIYPGRQLVAGEVKHTTSKSTGKPYTQLKKVKLSDPTPAEEPTTGHDQGFPDVPENRPEDKPEATPMAGSLADKWAQVHPPETVPETVAEAPKGRPDYEKGTNARWAIGMAYRAYIQVMGTPEDGAGDFPFKAVQQHAQELLDMFEVLTNESED